MLYIVQRHHSPRDVGPFSGVEDGGIILDVCEVSFVKDLSKCVVNIHSKGQFLGLCVQLAFQSLLS